MLKDAFPYLEMALLSLLQWLDEEAQECSLHLFSKLPVVWPI
jgi:hypothetical protein